MQVRDARSWFDLQNRLADRDAFVTPRRCDRNIVSVDEAQRSLDGRIDSIPTERSRTDAIRSFFAAARGGSWDDALRALCVSAGWRGARVWVRAPSGAAIGASIELGLLYGSSTGDSSCVRTTIERHVALQVEGAVEADLWIADEPGRQASTQSALPLQPDLEQALALALELRRQAWLAGQLARDADTSPIGRIVVSSDMGLLYVNRAARAMAVAGDAFAFCGNKLTLRRGTDQAVLDALAARIADASHEESTRLQWRRNSARWPYTVRAAAIVEADAPCLELTIIDREPDDPPCDPLIVAGFDLTRAEVRVVRALLEGYSHDEIAARDGIVRGTVKLHAEHAMKKMGVRRRPELMRRLLAPLVVRVPRSDGPS